MIHILYNPLSNNKRGEESVKKVFPLVSPEEYILENCIDVRNTAVDYFDKLALDDIVILCGGDGTLNHFINEVYPLRPKQKIYFYPCGSGNDFANDVGYDVKLPRKSYKEFISLNQYMENLPQISVNGIKRYFINGIGYGIDGYACEAGDDIRATSDKQVNYTLIAIKGLLGKYRPRNATVTIDGKVYSFKKVWFCPVMLGKFYGGGMMVAPTQDRLNKEHTVSNACWSGASVLKTMICFPKIFTGDHLHNKCFSIISGHNMTVEFDKPCALQIDGETVRNVKSFNVQYL